MTPRTTTRGIPPEIMHPGDNAFRLATRIHCIEASGGASPAVEISFLANGAWTEPVDWWRVRADATYQPEVLGASLTEHARAAIDDRGWELLNRLGYLPSSWHEVGQHAVA